jgi:antitoxin PrlF
MTASTLTSKGQITLPKSVRDRLRLAAGDSVEFVETPNGFLLRPTRGDIRKLKGSLPVPAHAVTLAQMQEAIETAGIRKR